MINSRLLENLSRSMTSIFNSSTLNLSRFRSALSFMPRIGLLSLSRMQPISLSRHIYTPFNADCNILRRHDDLPRLEHRLQHETN